MKKKRKLIGLWIVLAMILAIGVFAFIQRANIRAAVRGLKYTPEQLQQEIEENRQHVQDVINGNGDITVRDLTDEEKEALVNGTMTRDEIIEQIIKPGFNNTAENGGDDHGQITDQSQLPETNETDGKNETDSKETNNTPDPDEQYRIDLSSLIAEVYVLQAEYNAELEGMMEEAKEEYYEKTGAERGKTALVKWASGYISRASALEKECDDRMDDIVSRINALLKEHGSDTAIVNEIVYAYANEKSLQKSWYLSEMQKRGLLG